MNTAIVNYYVVVFLIRPGPSGSVFQSQQISHCILPSFVGSAKADPVRLKWGFGEGLLKDKFAFFEASKNPIPKRRKRLIAKRPFL